MCAFAVRVAREHIDIELRFLRAAEDRIPRCSLRFVHRAFLPVDGRKRYAQPFGELLLSELELRPNSTEDGGHVCHICDICHIAILCQPRRWIAEGNTRAQRSKSVAWL